MHHMQGNMRECIQACTRCHETCLTMASTHCLELGGEHAKPQHIQLMLTCAEICRASVTLMILGTRHAVHICRECAEICDECARECERLGQMEECVTACRECAEACRMDQGDGSAAL